MIKVGIVGGTGYTGVELLRLLARHPQVELKAITSRKEAGMPVADMFPNLRGRVKLAFSTPEEAGLENCDVVFFATPNGIAMQQAASLLDAGVKVIDLAADFRIKNFTWRTETWNTIAHHSAKQFMIVENSYIVTLECQLVCTRKTAGAATKDRNFFASWLACIYVFQFVCNRIFAEEMLN